MRKSTRLSSSTRPAPAPAAPETMAHVLHTGTLNIDAPADLALRLFTAPGEQLWIDDWRPTVLSGDGLQKGSVFVTDVDEPTIWIVIEYDPDNFHARYARVAPGTRAGTVDVRVAAAGACRARATISYELTGLSKGGNTLVSTFDAGAFEAMLAEWERAIAAADINFEQAFESARQ